MTKPVEFIVEQLYFTTYNRRINPVAASCSLCVKNPALLKYGRNSSSKGVEQLGDELYCCVPCACKMILEIVDGELGQWNMLGYE
jgi:hypothetical protein